MALVFEPRDWSRVQRLAETSPPRDSGVPPTDRSPVRTSSPARSIVRKLVEQGARILLVDDDIEVREVVTRDARSRRVRRRSRRRAAKRASRELERATFDLVVLDWKLPGMTGLELCRAMRARGGLALPVLFLTANASPRTSSRRSRAAPTTTSSSRSARPSSARASSASCGARGRSDDAGARARSTSRRVGRSSPSAAGAAASARASSPRTSRCTSRSSARASCSSTPTRPARTCTRSSACRGAREPEPSTRTSSTQRARRRRACPGLSLLPAAHDAVEPGRRSSARDARARWLARLRALPADYLVDRRRARARRLRRRPRCSRPTSPSPSPCPSRRRSRRRTASCAPRTAGGCGARSFATSFRMHAPRARARASSARSPRRIDLVRTLAKMDRRSPSSRGSEAQPHAPVPRREPDARARPTSSSAPG